MVVPILAAIFLGIGVAFTFFRERSVPWFCRMGKAQWRLASFGLADMNFLYREDRVKKSARIIGPIFLLVGIALICAFGLSFSGPGTFAAMREVNHYLTAKYGYSLTSKISASWAATDGSVELTYVYAGHAGHLHAVWQTNHYTFLEIPPSAQKQ